MKTKPWLIRFCMTCSAMFMAGQIYSQNVGIGTDNPQAKLHVNGIIYSSEGGFRFPDSTLQISACSGYEHVFTVAKSGAEFDSISEALDSCISPGWANRYLVRVMPGTYDEDTIYCKDFVDIRGSGKNSCVIDGRVICSENMLIEGFRINDGILCNGVSPLIMNNFITKFQDTSIANTGITLQSWSQAWIVNNDITACLYFGIRCNGLSCSPWIIGNRIFMNGSPEIEGAGVWIYDGSPVISNNLIEMNHWIGIKVTSSTFYDSVAMAKPVISDNIIRMNQYLDWLKGEGINISGNSEPRILSNDISGSVAGILIDEPSQPVITSNQIHDNYGQGIFCTSRGFGKTVSISYNNLQYNCDTNYIKSNLAALLIIDGNPLVTHNVIIDTRFGMPDIDYSACGLAFPVITSNVYDLILRTASPPFAGGSYNSNSTGDPIDP